MTVSWGERNSPERQTPTQRNKSPQKPIIFFGLETHQKLELSLLLMNTVVLEHRLTDEHPFFPCPIMMRMHACMHAHFAHY
jgi:hypothetical protein